ncbi:YciI family protein [Actinocrispum sp. NPDC049592]|uniref:YciI family protein n=1 Tax=Actinocrispum sp. NPDC049592 TaxID=3154835 RepID=UPI00344A5CB0
MRFLMMHRLPESAAEAWNPSPEFVERMGGMIQDWVGRGILITAEGVHTSERGARVRKTEDGVTSADGPFGGEVIGGFALINAKDRAEAVALAEQYAAMFDRVEVEIREIHEFE